VLPKVHIETISPIGKAVRGGKLCYYINDGVYHTYSGVIFDHCQYPVRSFKKDPTQICSVFGPRATPSIPSA
jgi:ornithine decarboxylase